MPEAYTPHPSPGGMLAGIVPDSEAGVLPRILLVIGTGSLVLLAACGGGGATSSAVDAEAGEAGVDVGSVTAVDLPIEFPADLPLPDDATAVHVAATAAGGPAVWFASGQTKDELTLFFEEAIDRDETWHLTWHTDVQESAGSYSLYAVASDNWKASIYVGNGGPGAKGYTKPYSFRVELTPA